MQRIYKNQAKNFRRYIAQVLIDGEWQDRTKPCGSKLVEEFALRLENLFGAKNVRIVNA